MLKEILLVDDDEQSLASTRKILELAGFKIMIARNGSEALDAVRAKASQNQPRFDLIVSDVRMPKMGGMEFLKALSICRDSTPVILMTAFGRVEDAVWSMKLGAVDFLGKPFKRDQLLKSVDAALARSHRGLAHEPTHESASETKAIPDRGITEAYWIGESENSRRLRQIIDQVAATSATVLIQGESGAGKELVAKQIHARSARAGKPWLALNCAAFPESLIESELFGHEKGAFTGAHQAKVGLFEAAQGGTVFLDEIGDMPIQLQAKLLRVLQEREIRRVGGFTTRKIDVRVLAASHVDLKKSVSEGRFRQDLLFRLDVVSIHVPALRERAEDIVPLAREFLRRHQASHGKSGLQLSSDAWHALQRYPWPGNVRELSNVLERAVILNSGRTVEPADFPPAIRSAVEMIPVPGQSRDGITIPLGTTLKDAQDLLIQRVLEATQGDKRLTAEILGITERTIYRKTKDSKDSELV